MFFKYLRQDDDGVKNVLSWVYNAIMQVEAEAQAGCATYERSDGRRLHRNGYRQRGLTTLYGDLVLKKPRFREEGFKTIVFEAYSRVEKAVLSLMGEPVNEFLSRLLGKIVYMYVDATYFHVRVGARYVSKALLIVVGVGEDGYRQVLGARICENEGEAFWTSLFEDLKRRGACTASS